jgi:hypothetical protein
MKIYLLVILIFFVFYLAFNFKEGFQDSDTIGYKSSYDLNTYCKDDQCNVSGEDQRLNLYIKDPSEILPTNLSSPFIINFYNMMKNCKYNSNCYAETSNILKKSNIDMNPNKDGYLDFICDKKQVRSVTLNRVNHEMETSTNNINRPNNFPVKTRVQIQSVPGNSKLNNLVGSIIPFKNGEFTSSLDEDTWRDNYRVLFDEKPSNFNEYYDWCMDSDNACGLINGVTSDENGSSMVLKSNYLKNISGSWWNPDPLDTPLKDPDKSVIDLDIINADLIHMSKAANEGKKEVCKCIGDKMINHLKKYTINGSSNDAIRPEDKLNIQTCK